MGKNQVWAGLDLGQSQTHVCVVDDAGATIHEQSCETTLQAISEALSRFPKRRLALIAAEAGGETHVIRKLRDAHYPVALFEARKASKFLAVRRSKTDEGDARGLADLARLGQHTVSKVYIKTPECERLRSELVMRQRLVKMRVAADNALKSRFRLHGLRLQGTRTENSMKKHVAELVELLKQSDGIDLGAAIQPLLEVCLGLRKYIKKLDFDFRVRAESHSVCRRLMGVYGVGAMCSIAFYSTIEDPTRIRRNSDVAAYLGLVPKRYQSGEVSYTKGITKSGNKLTRTLLVTAAMSFVTRGPDSELKEWGLALKKRLGSRRAHVAVARKLAIILLTMWKNEVGFKAYPSETPQAAQM